MEPISIPQIHDTPVSGVLEALALRPDGTDRFVASSLPQLAKRIYGGQVIAQALLAGCATMERNEGTVERPPHSLHAYFLRVGDHTKPVSLQVERLRDGRSFSARRIDALQDGRVIMSMVASFQLPQADLDAQEQMPAVAHPDDLEWSLHVLQRQGNPVAKYLGKTGAFEMRHVGSSLYEDVTPVPDARQAVWLRPWAKLPTDMDQCVHRALIAYVSDQFMLEPVLRANGLSWQTPQLAVATLDHAMWFYRNINVNDWHLFVQSSPTTFGSRGLGLTKIFNEDGQLVAAATQEGMLRMGSKGSWALPTPPVH
ncbi:MAG: thioesterase family protein [Actinomycetaceae bacterium]|nr:thioesterase family protein [Actinomycetaceae bacterium]